MSRFAIQQIKFNNVLYPGIAGWSADTGIEVNSDALDGTVHETAHHGVSSAPVAELTTRNLAFMSVLDGSLDAPLKDFDGTNGLVLYGAKGASRAPGYASGSVHLTRSSPHGILLCTGINWSEKQKAELALKAMFLSANGTSPALVPGTAALPALPVPDFGYVLSSLTLNGSAIESVESLGITCDHKAAFEYLAGLPEPTDVSMAGVNGAVAWRLAANIGDCDVGSGTGACAAVFKRLAQGGGIGTDTLTVTFNANWSVEEGLGGQAGSPMGRQLVVRPRLSGTTRPVTWTVA